MLETENGARVLNHSAYRRSIVDMEMRFLHALAMVSLRVGQSEKTFLEEFTIMLVSMPSVCFQL